MTTTPAALLTDGELVLRCPGVDDVDAFDAAVRSSIDHLRPWMPWAAAEPISREDRLGVVERWIESWRTASDFPYAMFIGDEVVGSTGLHPRVAHSGLEIGYWVRADRCGRGIATRAARLLTDAAFELGHIDHVEIHHDKANVRSGRVPAKLGYTVVREVADHISAPGDVGVSVEWRVDRAAWAARAEAG